MSRSRANVAHIRQSRPDSGFGVEANGRGGTDAIHCRANTAHTRQSRPDSGLGVWAAAAGRYRSPYRTLSLSEDLVASHWSANPSLSRR